MGYWGENCKILLWTPVWKLQLTVILYWYRFLLHWTKLPHIDKFWNMYFTSFRCNRILFRWYTNKEWQRSFFMRQLQKVKVVKVKVESWENLLNFQINWEETTTAVQKLCWILQNLALSSFSPPALSSSPLSPSNYWGRSLLIFITFSLEMWRG